MIKIRTMLLGFIFLFSADAYSLRSWPQLQVHYDYLNNRVLIINGKYTLWDELNQIAVLSLWDYFKLRAIGYKPSIFLTYSTGRELELDVFFDSKFQKFVLLRRLYEGEVIIEYVENFNSKFVFNLRSVMNSHCHETDEPRKRLRRPRYIFYPDKSAEVDWLTHTFLINTQEGHEILLSLNEERVISDTYKPELRSEYCSKHYHGPHADYVFPDFIHKIYLLDQNDQERGVSVEDIFPERVKKAGMRMPTRCQYESFKGGGGRCEPIWGEAFEKKQEEIPSLLLRR